SQVRPLLPNDTTTRSASPSLRNSSRPRSRRSTKRLRSAGIQKHSNSVSSRVSFFHNRCSMARPDRPREGEAGREQKRRAERSSPAALSWPLVRQLQPIVLSRPRDHGSARQQSLNARSHLGKLEADTLAGRREGQAERHREPTLVQPTV